MVFDGLKDYGKSIANFLLQPLLAVAKIVDKLTGTNMAASIEKITGATSVLNGSNESFKDGYNKEGKDKRKTERDKLNADFRLKGMAGYFDKKKSLNPTTPTTTKTTTTGGGLDSGIDKVTTSAPKSFNINIDKLVEKFEITTNNMQEGAEKTKDMVLKALLTAVNDVQIAN
tara:strand:- start:1070 stop:1585 length:516 start_codon:yes stop_codon:yes gene_type:complete